MFKRILAALFALIAATAFAAVDVNKATQAELESVKGIGPSIASKILDERKKSSFKDWADMVDRVKGVGDANAAKFSAEGLTVNGASFKGAPAAKAAEPKAVEKAATKADATKPSDKPAVAASAAADKPAKTKKDKAAAAEADDKSDKKGKKSKKAEAAEAAASGAKK